MKRGSRFLIGLAAAGLTFGTLTATMGPRHFNNYRSCYGYSHGGGWHHGWNNQHGCENAGSGCENQNAAPPTGTVTEQK